MTVVCCPLTQKIKNMADDKKIIFSMVGVSKVIPPSRQILKDIYLSFYYGAKIGIIGLNGSGKSTLLKIIAGKDKSYNGEVVFSPGYSVGMLDQEPELDNSKTVKEVVQEGIQEVVDILKRYEEVNARFMEELTDDEMNALVEEQGQLTDLIEQHDAWDLDSKLDKANLASRIRTIEKSPRRTRPFAAPQLPRRPIKSRKSRKTLRFLGSVPTTSNRKIKHQFGGGLVNAVAEHDLLRVFGFVVGGFGGGDGRCQIVAVA